VGVGLAVGDEAAVNDVSYGWFKGQKNAGGFTGLCGPSTSWQMPPRW
jgi:hypothetical protein